MTRPQLYVDSGRNFNAQECVDLHFVPARDGCGVASFSLVRGARALRFDPSMQPGTVSIGRAWLRRMPRTEHLGRIVVRLARRRIKRRADLARYAWRAWQVLAREGPHALVARMRSADCSDVIDRNDYRTWVARYDTITEQDRADMARAALSFPQRPLLSIVMPVYDAPEALLRMAIDSVLAQTYENWELCIVDDCSKQRHVRKVLDPYQRKDA